MTGFKGIDKLDKIVSDFLKPYGLTAEFGSDFEFNFKEGKVYYTLVVPTSGADLFLKNAEARFPDIHANIFIWSLLHEVGHSQTFKNLTDWEEDLSQVMKQDLYKNKKHWTIEERHSIYFSCPDEKAATDWAGEYMMNHTDDVLHFLEKFQKAVVEFYAENDIKVVD